MAGLRRRVALSAMLLLAAACSSTTWESKWRDPTAQPVNPQGKTIAALFVSADVGKRRAAEDAIVRAIDQRGGRGVAAYTIIPDELLKNSDATRQKLKDAGCDGVVVMRVLGQQEKLSYVPGTYAGPGPYPYYGAWGYGWGSVYSPGYMTTDTEVSVQTLVYSLVQEKLLWAGTSKTVNPTNIDSFVTEVANAAAYQMSLSGLLVKS